MRATLSLIAGVRLDLSASPPRIAGPDGALEITAAPGVIEAIRLLGAGEKTYEGLVDHVVARAGIVGLRALHRQLAEVLTKGWLAHRVQSRGKPFVTAVPVSADYGLVVESMGSRTCVLSRFAFLRKIGENLVLESPIARAQLLVHDRRALDLLWQLSIPRRPRRVFGHNPRLSPGVLRAATDLLWSAGFLTPIEPGARSPHDERPPFLHWEFHDLLFHSRTRFGRHRWPLGATYPLEGRVPAPPAIRPPGTGERLPLSRPRITRLRRTDWPLTRALESRRSRREHGDVPITRKRLAEFLYRSARARSVDDDGRYATSARVYPSGGAAYPLELYVAVRRCDGLDPGLYHYCPQRHDLERLADMTSNVHRLLESAAEAARTGPPQILVVIAARFLRTSWKYSSISYALILKDVGVLLQTMYLVATAMGLAVCAIGGGDSDLFAKAAGTDYYLESSVGEIILGLPPQ